MPPPLKITAITGDINEPSARFRVRQYISGLRKYNIQVTEALPFVAKSGCYWYHKYPFLIQILPQLGTAILRLASRVPAILESYKSDITWIQREFLTATSTTEALTKKPRLFDIDDAIWLRLKFTSGFAKRIVRKMDGIICGNEWIADYFSDCNVPIWIIPTGVDTNRWRPAFSLLQNNFYLGWIGTAGNYQYLYDIEPALFAFFSNFPSAKLLICSDCKPRFSNLSQKNIHYIRWSKDNEVKAVQQMNVGLMPLRDNDWEKGKCSFKMLLYMSTGIPVIVSPVGMNKEILKIDTIGFGPANNLEWHDALTTLYENINIRNQMGVRARQVVKEYYSLNKIIPQLSNIFYEIAS